MGDAAPKHASTELLIVGEPIVGCGSFWGWGR